VQELGRSPIEPNVDQESCASPPYDIIAWPESMAVGPFREKRQPQNKNKNKNKTPTKLSFEFCDESSFKRSSPHKQAEISSSNAFKFVPIVLCGEFDWW